MRKVACVYTTQIKRKTGTEICSGPCFHYTIDERRDSCFRKGKKCERNPSGVSFAFDSRPQATVCAAERFRTNKKRHAEACLFLLVREMRLELTRRLPHAPQTCLSTYSSTLAYCAFPQCQIIIIANGAFVNHVFSQIPFFPRHFLLRNESASAIICGVSLRWKAGGSPCPSFSFRPSSRSAAPSS